MSPSNSEHSQFHPPILGCRLGSCSRSCSVPVVTATFFGTSFLLLILFFVVFFWPLCRIADWLRKSWLIVKQFKIPVPRTVSNFAFQGPESDWGQPVAWVTRLGCGRGRREPPHMAADSAGRGPRGVGREWRGGGGCPSPRQGGRLRRSRRKRSASAGLTWAGSAPGGCRGGRPSRSA